MSMSMQRIRRLVRAFYLAQKAGNAAKAEQLQARIDAAREQRAAEHAMRFPHYIAG